MKKVKTNYSYAYHVQNPFDTLRPMYDKYGVLHFISYSKYLEEIKKPKNVWKETRIESALHILGLACLPFGFLLICFIIGQ